MKLKALAATEPVMPDRGDGIQLTAQIIWLDDMTDVLCVNIWDGEEDLCGRWFADKRAQDTRLLWGGNWSRASIATAVYAAEYGQSLEMAGRYAWYYYMLRDVASKEDEKVIRDYLGTDPDVFEANIKLKRRQDAETRRKNRITDMMRTVPEIPEDMYGWAEDLIMPGERIVFERQENERKTTYKCTACGSEGKTDLRLKHGKMNRCPSCGAEVRGFLHKGQDMRKAEYLTLLSPMTDGRWALRIILGQCVLGKHGKDVDLYERIRIICEAGEHIGKVWYGYGEGADLHFWDSRYDHPPCDVGTYLFPGNLDEAMTAARMQHSGLEILAEKRIKHSTNAVVRAADGRPYIEYLLKLGLYRMVEEMLKIGSWHDDHIITKHTGRTAQECMGIGGQELHRLRQIDGGISALMWLREIMRAQERLSQSALTYLDQFSESQTEDLIKIKSRTGSSAERVANYLQKNGVKPRNDFITTWLDYIRMAEAEGMNDTDDIVRFPKEMRARHDELLERINRRKNEEKKAADQKKHSAINLRIAERLPEAARFYWEDDQYIIIPAGTCEELMNEGAALHHCVGASDNYMNRMAEGESWILFMRKKEDLETPYYTIEVDMKRNTVKQFYSAYDRQPDKDLIKGKLDRMLESAKRKDTPAQIAV